MATQWFYQAVGKEVGPVSGAELLTLAQHGTITPDTLVRKAPDGTWAHAERVQGLFAPSNEATPPMPVAGSDATETTEGVFVEAQSDDSEPASESDRRDTNPKPTSPSNRELPHQPENVSVSAIIAILLIVGGVIGLIASLGMDTTVETGSAYNSNRVYNIGLMEQRRIYLIFSAASIIVGSALAWAGFKPRCPRCNGMLGGEPELCRHCRTELVWVFGVPKTANLKYCPHCRSRIPMAATRCPRCTSEIPPDLPSPL